MKIVNKKTFLQLPEGTFFCSGIRFSFDSLCVKKETIGNDFFYINLCAFDFSGSDQLTDRWYDSLDNGISYPINTMMQREVIMIVTIIVYSGGFLVFEEFDLSVMRSFLDSAIALFHEN